MTKPGEHKSGCRGEQWEDRGSSPLGLQVQACTGCGVRRTVKGDEVQDLQGATVLGLSEGLRDYSRARAEELRRLALRGEYSDEITAAKVDELTLMSAEFERLIRRVRREVADGQEG